MRFYIGTSGFSYPHWGNGIFYPKDLPQRKWFEYYCSHFNSIELNVSFYRLPKKEVFVSWHQKAGDNFVFSVKGSRFITHIKRLKDCGEAVKVFFEAISGLKWEVGDRTSKYVILWQLPPSLKQDLSRLESFLKLLPQDFRQAFEFRHESWFNNKTWEILRKYDVAVVFQDWPDWPITREVTADFVYVRFHCNRDLYSSEYTEEELKACAKRIGKHLKEGRDAYVYFNNDAQGFATTNALRLKELVEK